MKSEESKIIHRKICRILVKRNDDVEVKKCLSDAYDYIVKLERENLGLKQKNKNLNEQVEKHWKYIQ